MARAEISITIEAGKLARKNEPVCVPLQLTKEQAAFKSLTLSDGGRPLATGQFTDPSLLTQHIKADKDKVRKDLWFILPSLDAEKSLTLKVEPAKGELPESFAWKVDPKARQDLLSFGDRPVLRYEYPLLDESTPETRVATFKVFHQLYDPTGKNLITKAAGGQFTHHRGLYYGFMKTTYGKNTVDTWHCPDPKKKNEAHQAHSKSVSSEAGPVLGRHTIEIDWNGIGKKTFAKELRELTVYNLKGGHLIEFTSQLTPVDGPVKLDGDPQHAGFHFRASNEVAEKTKNETIFIRPSGVGVAGKEVNWPGDKKHVDLPWLAMSFVLGKDRYTAAYLDKPTNPKEARFSERTYGRFGSYFVTEATKEKPVVVNYRVWVQPGQMKPEEVAELAARFVTPVVGRE